VIPEQTVRNFGRSAAVKVYRRPSIQFAPQLHVYAWQLQWSPHQQPREMDREISSRQVMIWNCTSKWKWCCTCMYLLHYSQF